MHANIHTVNTVDVKSIVKQSQNLFGQVNIALFAFLTVHQNIHSRHGDTVVFKWNRYIVLFRTNGYTRYLCTFTFWHLPFLYQVACVFILKVLFILLFLYPQRKISSTRTQNKSFRKYTNRTYPNVIDWFNSEHIIKLSFHLEIVA